MSFNNQLPYALLPPPPPPPPPEDDFPTAPAYAAASFVKESPVEPHYLSVPPPGFVPSVPELSYPSISAYYPQPWPSQWQGTAPGGYAEQPTDPYYTQSYAYGSYYSSYADEIQRYEEWKKKFDEVQPKQNAYPDYKTEFRERYLILHPRIDHRSSRSREPYHDKLRSHDRRRRSRTRSRDRIRKRSRSRSGDRRSRVVSSRDRPSRDRPSRDRRSRDRRSRDRRSNDRRSRDPRDRRSPDRRSPDRRSPDRRSPDRRSPDCRSPDRRSPDRRSPDCRSPDRRSPDRRSPDRRSPDRRSPDCRSPDRRSPDCRSPDRRSRDRHSKARRPRSPRYSRSSSMRSERLSRETVDRSETPAREGVSEHGSSTVGSIVKEESGRDSLFSSRMRGLSLSDRSKSVDKNRGSSKAKSRTSDKDIILEKFRKNFCRTSEEIVKKIEEIANEDYLEDDDDITWCRSSPAELYYKSNPTTPSLIEAKARNIKLSETFFEELIERGRKARPEADELPPSRVYKAKLCKHKLEKQSDSSDSSSDSIESDDSKDEADRAMDELQRKQKHPRRLHPEMWYNTAGEMNDGPACRCSAKTKRTGIRHSVYAGEEIPPLCDPNSNNFNKLHHYRILISPPTNFLIKNPTIITHDDHEFLFSGFSVFSHYPIGDLPDCKVIRFNIEYTISYVEEKTPLNFTVKELDLFQEYLFIEILELVDLNLGEKTADGCSQFHFMPRFVRNLPEGGCEVLSMCEVLKYLLKQSGPLVKENDLPKIHKMDQIAWQKIVDDIKGMIVTYPGKKPCSVRVDQLDRNPPKEIDKSKAKLKYYPEIVHFGIRPPEISYAGNPQYQKALRYYVKYRHLVANMAKPTWEERRRLQEKGAHLQDMRTHSRMKRDVTVAVSSQGFHLTGLMCDIVQHAMLLPVLVCHLRFHNSLNSLEDILQYKFLNRRHLQLALTHPSYRENFGTNPDHARNSLTNCGIRQPKYGDRRIHYMNTRKRGINTLINIMSRFGKKRETESAIGHNERLEFLGDAVVEFLTSIHLFRMFPDLEEGGLATFRAAIVQNQHLALLAKKIGLEKYMLYAHGSDLCHDLDLRHAMANCFEALIGAMFLDGGIDVADNVFALALWMDNLELLDVWTRERNHPLQEQEPLGDRKYIKDFDFLQRLAQFESTIGIYFKHIRLLARAFTDRSLGFTNLTLGSNQRLEFLGDTVLQLVVSDKLYRHFPEHHEGHLSLLRSSLVNNRTQSVVCDDLDMAKYAVYHNPKTLPSTKGKADLLEAFLGALYIDKNIEYCTVFCNAVLFPRLQEFILNQDWNDPKSKLQQCCLTLRTMEGGEPDIPIYKVIECLGPTNTRVYTVAVYFRGNRLATAAGHSIQEAEMNAAKNALDNGKELFPQLDHQKRVIAERIKSHRRSRNQKARKNGKDLNRAAGSKDCDGQNKKTKAPNYDLLNENLPKAYMHGKTWEDEGDDSSDAESVKSYESTKWQARSRSTSFTSTSTESGSEDKNEDTDLDCTSDDSLSSSPVQGKTATVAIDILEEFKGRSLKLRSEDEVEKENVEAKIDESVINVEERAKVKAKKFKEEKIQKKDKEKVDKKVEEQVEDNVEEKVKENVEKKVKGKIDESVMNVEERAIVKAKKFKEEKIQKKDKEKVDKKVEEQVEDNVEEKVKEKVEKKVKGKIDESVMNVEERAKVKAKKFKEEKIQKKDKEKVDKKVEEQVEDNVEEKVKEKVEKKVKGKIEEKLKGKIEEKVKGKAEKEVRVKDEDKFVKKVRNKIEEKAEKKAEEKIKEMVKDKSKGKTERKVKEKDVEKVRNKIEEKAEKRAEEKIKEMVKDKSKGKTERKVKEKVVEKVRNEIEKKAEEKIKEMVKDKSNGKTERKVKEKIERKFKEEIVKKVKDNIKEKMKDKEKNEEKFEMEKKVSNVVKVLPSNYYDFVASYKKPNPDLEEGEIESD